MATIKTGSFQAVSLTGSYVEVSTDGGTTYSRIPGVASLSHTPGERSESEVRAFAGTRTTLGAIGSPDVSISIGAWMPHHSTTATLRTAYNANNTLAFRFVTPRTEIAGTTGAGKTAAIAVNGTVTFVGSGLTDFAGGAYYPGVALVIGGSKYVVDAIEVNTAGDAATSVTVAPAPTSAVPAGVYSVEIPSLRWAFTGQVQATGGFEAGSDEGASLSSTIDIQPSGTLAAPEIV